jgi:hypothetical protein
MSFASLPAAKLNSVPIEFLGGMSLAVRGSRGRFEWYDGWSSGLWRW